MKRLLVLPLVALAPPTAAHDWYSDLVVPGLTSSCCNERDCRPAEHRLGVDGRDEILVGRRWWPVAPEVLLRDPSPDGEWHVCTFRRAGPDAYPIRCAVAPARAA